MILRPYQQKDLDKLRTAYREGKRAPLFVGPTGYGKTVLFATICKNRVERGGRPMILCHRAELVDQIVRALTACGITPGVIAAGVAPSDSPVQVASVQTLINRLGSVQAPDLIVVDEAHHATLTSTWGRILSFWPTALRLGVTATPVRLSGEGLDDIFDSMVIGPSTQDLINDGYLTPVRVFAPRSPDLSSVSMRGGDFALDQLATAMSSNAVVGDAVDHYRRHGNGRRAIVFCVSVAHALAVAQRFAAEGYRSQSIDGSLKKAERAQRIKQFTTGEISVLTSCNLVSEGFDLPAIELGISLRPTQSLGLWLQQVGRVLRPAEGKSEAIILDHAGNTLRHGLPTETRKWSLKGRKRKVKKSKVQEANAVRVCQSCYAANPFTATTCKECGKDFPVQQRKQKEIDGELEEVTASRPAGKRHNPAATLNDLIALGTARGYQQPRAWAMHVWSARERKKA